MEEIDLYDLLRFYVKKWLTVAIFVMVAGIAGIVFTYYIQSPKYESKATLLIIGANRASAQDSVVLNNYVQLFTSRRVLEPVITDQEYEQSYNALAQNVTAQNVKNTDVITVSIATSDANTSKQMLENAIESFRSQAKELYGDNNIKINVVDGASTPGAASNIRPLMQVGLVMAIGFAIAIISLFFVYDYQHSQRRKVSKAAVAAKKPATKKSAASVKKTNTRSKAKPTTKK